MRILVTGIEKGTAKTGNEFLKVSCVSEDKNSHLFYLWDSVQTFESLIQQGNKIFECMFGGDANFPKIVSFQPAQGTPDEFYSFIYPSDEHALKVYESLFSAVTDPFLRDLIIEVMSQPFLTGTVRDAFIVIPAAKAFHHDFRYGLLRHTHEVMSFVSRVCSSDLFKMGLNDQIALTGALLHDVGKVYEYEFDGISSAVYGVSSTINQIYLGSHLYKGAEMVALAYSTLCAKNPEYANNLCYLKTEHVKHIIMSHHLQQEWGAIPKQPKTLEAYLVFEGDYFSAAFGKFSSLDWSNISENDLMRETSKFDNFFGFTPLIHNLTVDA